MIELRCIAMRGLNGNCVAVSPLTAQSNGWRNGQPIGIRGDRQTVAILHIRDELTNEQVGMGSTLRINAGTRDADTVSIEDIEINPLSKAKLQPIHADISELQANEVLQSQSQCYVSKGDRITFTIQGEPLEFQVTACRPRHGWLAEKTQLNVSTKKAKRGDATIPTVSFDDIGGLDDTIEAIKEIAVVPIVHPEVYLRTGQDPPKGIVLHGPPGVGKTMLAKALAREAQTTFHSISGPEVMRGVYGESEKMLRELFEQARRDAPSVIYIDEIDAIAASRENQSGELEKRVLTQLLTLMDGFEERGKVLVIGSTNRLESIDMALLRAGRFDRRIHVPYPDTNGREKILEIHSSSMPLDGVVLPEWAKKTNGYTGADLANLCRHASTVSLRRLFGVERLVSSDDFTEEELQMIKIIHQDFEDAFDLITPIAISQRRPASMGHVAFDDVIGHVEAKKVMFDHIVLPILNSEIYAELGLNCAGGVILHGPPGTGKTMLGRAAASQAGVQFMAVSGPELISKWVGESERAVRELFQKAEDLAPVVIFLDEFDSIGSKRNAGESSVHSNSVVAQLLSLMDGLGKRSDIFLMASTNQLNLVDEAFLRPGRFDKTIRIDKLEITDYPEFFLKSLESVPNDIMESDIDDLISRLVDPLSGAELAGLVTSAKRAAARRCIKNGKSPSLTMADFEEALSFTPALLRGLGGGGGTGYA
jgi:transitional endoplasmic reticulum ATPase